MRDSWPSFDDRGGFSLSLSIDGFASGIADIAMLIWGRTWLA